MRSRLIGAVVLSIGTLASACANAPTDDGTGDGGGISYHTGATQVVLRIEQGGGFVPIEWNLTNMPMVSLFGDGLVVMPGAQIEIYPGPALPALSHARKRRPTIPAPSSVSSGPPTIRKMPMPCSTRSG